MHRRNGHDRPGRARPAPLVRARERLDLVEVLEPLLQGLGPELRQRHALTSAHEPGLADGPHGVPPGDARPVSRLLGGAGQHAVQPAPRRLAGAAGATAAAGGGTGAARAWAGGPPAALGGLSNASVMRAREDRPDLLLGLARAPARPARGATCAAQSRSPRSLTARPSRPRAAGARAARAAAQVAVLLLQLARRPAARARDRSPTS